MAQPALHIHAGPRALAHVRQHGLRAADVRLVPAAAGGPKGLILSHLDRHLFGHWLPGAPPDHVLHLAGASIGAWRMATALMPRPVEAFERLAIGYIAQRHEPEAGRRFPSPERVSAVFRQTMAEFFRSDVASVLTHPRWHLHVVTSRAVGRWAQGGTPATALGFAGMVLDNAWSRERLGRWLERSVFSSHLPPPLALHDHPTRLLRLTRDNFMDAVQASCSIPFVLQAVRDIAGSPPGAHWDGGLIDYHLHWPFSDLGEGVVLYPHFQRQVVPGWLDKAFPRRHRATPALDNLIVLAPSPEWVQACLPHAKLPDRHDFKALDHATRVSAWSRAVAESERLSDEWQDWLRQGCPADRVLPL